MRAETLHYSARTKWLDPITVTHPYVAEEAWGWDPSRYTAGSKSKMDWKCKNCDHEWNAPICIRTLSNNGCPVCRRTKAALHYKEPLSVTHPNIAVEALGWNPDEWTAGSAKKQWWRCKDCGGEWEARISHRALGRCRCKQCNSGWKSPLSVTHPWIAEEACGWDPSKVTAGSNRKEKWFSKKCEHIWEDTIKNRTLGAKCRVCTGLPTVVTSRYLEIDGQRILSVDFSRTLAACHPDIASQLVHPEFAELVSRGSKIVLEWECPVYRHHWYAAVHSRTSHDEGCPQCAKTGFDRVAPAYLYFVMGERERFDLSEFGITKDLVARLKKHRSYGFTVNSGLPVCWFEVGRDAEVLETRIKQKLKEMGVLSAREDPLIKRRFVGWQESFRSELLSVKDLRGLLSVLGLDSIDVSHEWGVVPVLSSRGVSAV